MSAADHLARLGALAGVAHGYHDIWGGWHEPSEGTLRALLGAMGLDVSSDSSVASTVAAEESAGWRRPVPDVHVVRAGEALRVPVVVPEHVGGPLRWRLVAEDGAVRAGSASPRELEQLEQRDEDGATLRRVVLEIADAGGPGYHTLEVDGVGDAGTACRIIVAPRTCHRTQAFAGGARTWGVMVQLPGLRSRRNWGMGDLGDLRVAVKTFAALGADFIGLNPLHAPFLAEPRRASPYSPSSRRFLNPLYLAVEALDDFVECEAARAWRASADIEARIAAARAAELVDHALVCELKLEAFDLLYEHFRGRHLDGDTQRGRAFRAFQRLGGEALHRHAAADAAALGRTGEEAPERYAYLQWQTTLALDSVAADAAAAGMRIGLYLDLAVGVDRDGAEVEAHPATFALGASIGAPPDDFSPGGQSWTLPPWRPRALVEAGYEPFVQTLRAAMRAAGALRIDHVVGLMRQFWVPDDLGPADGAYVAFPVEDLLAVLALESVRHACVVVGEDLGTVPEEMRAALHAHGVLSYRVLYFERHWHGDRSFKRPHEFPEDALVTVSTHDLPTLAGFWTCHDLELRAALGQLPGSGSLEDQCNHRRWECTRLVEVLREQGLVDDAVDTTSHEALPDGLAEAVHAYVARTPCPMLAVQIEDLLGAVEQVNLPGTVEGHPNWRRKVEVAVEDWANDARLASVAAAIAAERGHP